MGAKHYAMMMHFHGAEVAILNVDGSWWIDWAGLAEMNALSKLQSGSLDLALDILGPLLAAARGNITEVSRERAEEIAAEYGATWAP